MNQTCLASAVSIACIMLLAACSPTGVDTPTASRSQPPSPSIQSPTGPRTGGNSTPSVSTPPAAYTVAGLLEDRPAFGESVLLDAHLADYMDGPGRGRFAGQCESIEFAPLFDEAVAAQITLFGGTMSMEPPNELRRVFPLDLRPRGPGTKWRPLPAHGRFRGYLLGRSPLNEATPTRPLGSWDAEALGLARDGYHACPNADRIFVIEELVEVFEENMLWRPDPYRPRDWDTVRLDRAGLSARRPPGWDVEVDEAKSAIRLRSGTLDGAAMDILVHDDPDGALLEERRGRLDSWQSFSARQSLHVHHPVAPNRPPLDFEILVCGSGIPTCGHALHVDGDRLIEITAHFPTRLFRPRYFTGPFQALVDSLVLDSTPLKTATPPIRTTIGTGPFLDREAAESLARLLVPDHEAWTIAPGRLVDEATARKEAASVGCTIDRLSDPDPYVGEDEHVHPEAVWILRTGGTWQGKEEDYVTLVDAKTSAHLCTKAIVDEDPAPVETPAVNREHLQRALDRDDHPLAAGMHAAFAGTRRGIPSLDRILGDPLLPIFVHELAGHGGGIQFPWVLHIAPQLGPTAVCGGGGCVVEGRDGKAFACPSESAGCTQLHRPSRCRLEHESLRCRSIDSALGWNSLTPRELCDPGPCVVSEGETERFVLLDGLGQPTEWPPGVDRLIVESSTMLADNGSLVRVGIVQMSSVPSVLGLGLSESD